MITRIILLFFAFYIGENSIFAQHNNFYLTKNNEIYWQKVYEVDKSKVEIFSSLNNLGKVNDINVSDSTYSGVIAKMNHDYKGAGISIFNALSLYTTSASVIIEVKDFKYRVTIRNINLVDSQIQ